MNAEPLLMLVARRLDAVLIALVQQIRGLLALPPSKRTDFLRGRLLNSGSAI